MKINEIAVEYAEFADGQFHLDAVRRNFAEVADATDESEEVNFSERGGQVAIFEVCANREGNVRPFTMHRLAVCKSCVDFLHVVTTQRAAHVHIECGIGSTVHHRRVTSDEDKFDIVLDEPLKQLFEIRHGSSGMPHGAWSPS